MPSIKQIKDKANKTVTKYNLTSLPRIFPLLKKIGIKITTLSDSKFPKKSALEAIYIAKSRTLQVKNSVKSATKLRFIAAQLLSAGPNYNKNMSFVETTAIYKKISEMQKELFASLLLISDTELEAKFPLTKLMLDGEDIIRNFSIIFGLHEAIIRFRLKIYKKEHPRLWTRYNLDNILF